MKEIEIEGLTIKYNENVISIKKSYEITDEKQMIRILLTFKVKTNYQTKRSIFSWLQEWKSHNRLYKLGLFRTHTGDCDLEENEKWYRLIAYQILGM